MNDKKTTAKHFSARFFVGLSTVCAVLTLGFTASGQGTITFNGGVGLGSTYYQEQGVWLQVVIPPETTGQDVMGIVGPVGQGSNIPYSSTPYMLWYRQHNPYNYVSLRLTDGGFFGLTSVQLADPQSPSPSPLTITFVGYSGTGASVTNTFITPGNGATTFTTYMFNPVFGSGLVSVDILAPQWAMDNLVWVPEPSALSLAFLGLLFTVGLRRRRALRE